MNLKSDFGRIRNNNNKQGLKSVGKDSNSDNTSGARNRGPKAGDTHNARQIYPSSAPQIISETAHKRFRQLCLREGRDPDNPWLADYVNYEWRHARPLVADVFAATAAPRILEFGCNIGATAIVLAQLGAKVTAIDIDPGLIDVAQSNVERYGLQNRIDLMCLQDSARIPAPDEFFDHIVCNSVLEYVPARALPAVQRELSRLLKPGGAIHVLGTSNRLWPWEIHSRRWLTNYLPRFFDRWTGSNERGLFPWELTNGFPGLLNDDLKDGGSSYLQAKETAGCTALKLSLLKILAAAAIPLRVTPGLLTPSIIVKMRKPAAN
jgi:2-polyprenyl-3-methyl-5-hydroxy-6-metoxy-1,4-benzoquinol methylase